MNQPKLFHVAPDNVHVMIHHDHYTGYWDLRASTTARDGQGDYELYDVRHYEGLTLEELVQVVEADLSARLNLT